ncbi:hypothetical protein BCF74_11294 [Knoellia remsis]|uniref:Uncharacterized protein n=2 Tax=Knoellia remsis TaxID=407159 RepID=A0A2T0UKC6_9MICO|nr:hypothetical protein BCF74_11294 [Knoellia remsis]
MRMSHLSPEEVGRLQLVAFWIREVFDERGHHIGDALEHDPSFKDGQRPRSGLARALMRQAVTIAASHVGLDVVPGEGGSYSLESLDRTYHRCYRVRTAEVSEGGFRILSSSDSIMKTDTDSLFTEEPWVLGYTLNLDNQIEHLFAAEVRDYVDGSPGELILGHAYMLPGAPPTEPGAFGGTNEGLPWDDDSLGEEESGTA